MNNKVKKIKKTDAEKITNRLNLILTFITVIATIVSVFIAWESAQKSLAQALLENWNILAYQSDTCGQINRVVIRATISNRGGATISLISASSKMASGFEVRPTLSSYTQETAIASIQGTPKVMLEAGPESDEIVKGNCIYVQVPGITDPEGIKKYLEQNGLLEFQSLSTPAFCVGDECHYINNYETHEVVVVSETSVHSSITELQRGEINPQDELPIAIASGEAKIIYIIWTPYLDGLRHYTELDVLLQFSDGNSLTIPLLDKIE